MTNIKSKRWIFVAVAIVALFAATGVAATHLAAQLLKTSIEHALGPGSRVADLRVGLASIEITALEVAAPDGWPTDTALRAVRIVMVPSLRDLISGHLLIDRVTLQHAYISAIGPRQDGSLRILPGMLDQSGHNRSESAHRRRERQSGYRPDGAQHRSRAIGAVYCLNSRYLRPAPLPP